MGLATGNQIVVTFNIRKNLLFLNEIESALGYFWIISRLMVKYGLYYSEIPNKTRITI